MFKQFSLLALTALMVGCSSTANTNSVGETSDDAALIHYDNVGECEGEPCIKSEAYHSQPFLVRAVGEERLYTVDLSYSREGEDYSGGSVEVLCSTDRPTVVSASGPPYSVYGVKPDRLFPSEGETYFANVYWSVCHDVQVKDIAGPEELVSRAASLGYSPDLVNTFDRKDAYDFFSEVSLEVSDDALSKDAPQTETTPAASANQPAPAASSPTEPNRSEPSPSAETLVGDNNAQVKIAYTSICEEGPCGQFYHTSPTLKNQSGSDQLFTVETTYESDSGELLSGPDPAQVMCSTDRPMVVKESGGEYIIFHMAPHQITSDEDMNLTSLNWSVCHSLQADLMSPDEMAQAAGSLGYDLSRSFNIVYISFFEPFEG